jgi:hypothetical protein
MKKLIMWLLVLGVVIAAVGMVMRRRSGAEIDEWRSFGEDSLSRAQDAVTEATDSATDAAKDAAS